MKKILLFLIFIAFFNAGCKKIEPDSFCGKDRITRSKFISSEGVIGYYPLYGRFSVNFPYTIVDSTAINRKKGIIGLLCDIDTSLGKRDLKVIVSGELKEFNSNEKFTPPTDSSEVLYLEIQSIKKK